MTISTNYEYETTLDDYLDSVLGRLVNGQINETQAHGILAQAFSRVFKHGGDISEQIHKEMQAAIYLAASENANRK